MLKRYKKQFTRDKRSGFTLVELLTAVSIFTIIMTISMGSILGIFDANRKTRTLKTAVTNLNIALESMSKEMRYGKNYHCGSGTLTLPQNCPAGDTLFSFLSSDNEQITYRLNNQSIERSINGGPYFRMTAPEVIIEDLKFHTIGAGTNNTLQPKTILMIKGYAGSGKNRTDFILQTLVSQRAIEI
jgi:prepilin-type N-terminal cleavage/methylation domain-containing protein